MKEKLLEIFSKPFKDTEKYSDDFFFIICRTISFGFIPTSESSIPRSTCGITKIVPSLFLGFFSEQNFDGKPTWKWSLNHQSDPMSLLHKRQSSIKGTVPRDFLLMVFQFPKYSQVKVHHRYQWHRRQIFPPVSLVLLIPVANLPPVSTTHVSTTPVANKGNNIRLQTS